jgi:hypothetical protein
MQQTTTPVPERRHARKVKVGGIIAGAMVLALAGVTVWQVWPGEESAVSVPSKVCENAVPSTSLKALLPETGESFEEERSYNFSSSRSRGVDGPTAGDCELSGGGKSLTINYRRLQSPDLTFDDVKRDAAEPGSTLITLGPAQGYIRGARTELFVSCPFATGRADLLEIEIGASGFSDEADSDTKQDLAGFAADTARVVAQELVGCESADDLPAGVPKLG